MAERRPEVVVARHGETEWSLSGQHTGRTDIPLTEAGRRSAGALRERLADRRFARVLTSPLGRARETCRLAGLGQDMELRDELREWDYGEYEGLTTPEVRVEKPGWTVWRDGCPGGESAPDVGRRVDRLIAELRELDGDAVLFAHGHVLRVLGARWIELAAEAGASLGLSTAALGILGYERERPVIWLWNDAGQLRGGGTSAAEALPAAATPQALAGPGATDA